ncbi:MAG: lipopolysaccharide biosynthesis protein [Gammaproteobacteria bacterium]
MDSRTTLFRVPCHEIAPPTHSACGPRVLQIPRIAARGSSVSIFRSTVPPRRLSYRVRALDVCVACVTNTGASAACRGVTYLSVERQAAAGLKWSSIAKIAGQTVSWGVTLLVFRLLTPEDYGLMALSMVLVSIVAGVAEFGLGSSLVQAQTLARQELSRVAGALAALNVGCGLVVALGAPLFAELLGDERLINVIRVLAIQFLLNAIEAAPQSLAYRQMEFKRLAGIELVATLTGAFTTLFLAWLGMGVWALVFGNLTGALLRTALYVALGGFVWPSFNFRGIASHLRFGGAVTASRLLWQITYQADVLIAGRVLGREAVGLYSVSIHLAALPMTKAMSIVNQVAFPAVARLQDELPRLRQRLLDSFRMLALVAIPALWGISAVAPEFVDVLLGPRWHPAITALQLVSLVAPLRMLAAILSTALTAVGRADLELRNTIVSAIVLPAAFLVGVQAGINGLAVSWLVAIPIIFALNFPRTLPELGFGFLDLLTAVRVPLAGGVVMYLAVAGTRLPLQHWEEAPGLPVLIVVGAVAYLATVRLLDRTIWTDVQKLAAAVRG